MISVAIDGPAGAGKSTLARRLAADFGYIYVDTGAMFRTIGLYALRAGKEPKDNEAVDALLPNITLEFAFIEGEQHIYLNGEDVSTAIRTEEVGMAASAVGANPAVRAFLLEMQRDMARTQNILMDGRDIGTVVLPNATVKIFLTASPEARATAMKRVTAGAVITQPQNMDGSSFDTSSGYGSPSFMPTGVALSTRSKPVGSALPWVTGHFPRPASRSTSAPRRWSSGS